MRLVFDVSSFRSYFSVRSTPTGIQRVIAMIVSHCANQIGIDNVFLSFFDQKSRKYLVISLNKYSPMKLRNSQNLAKAMGIDPSSKEYYSLKKKYSNNSFKKIIHRINILYRYHINDIRYFSKRNIDIESIKNNTLYLPFEKFIQDGDIFILIDAGWDFPKLGDIANYAKNKGAKVVSYIYDIIPTSHPHFVPSESTIKFTSWLVKTMEYTSKYITISKATAVHLSHFIEINKVDIPINPVPLAQEKLPTFEIEELWPRILNEHYPFIGSSAAVRPVINKNYVLVVGSRDIRKNLFKLALAWRALLEEGGDMPFLVVAGGRGGGNEAFDRLMVQSKYLNGKVIIVDQPTDIDLDHLYRNCLFTVFPSLFEGWGLPVGESLSYGKCVVTSSTSSMPEVAGDLALYCDPESVESIASAIKRLLHDQPLRRELEQKIKSTRLRTWDEVSEEFIASVLAE